MKRSAARQGPNVCELLGPTPILKMSNTDMLSCFKTCLLKIKKGENKFPLKGTSNVKS